MAFRGRLFSRAFRATRVNGAAGGSGAEAEVNEPGGRLFGEAIRKPGERRELFDWEIPYIGTLVLAGIMLGVGLNAKPETSIAIWAREEALARETARGASTGEEE